MALLKRKRSGLGEAMDVVTRFVNACNRHDAEGVYACLHPDFDSIQPMYPSRNFRGADQVRRNWQAIFDAEPGFRLTVLRSAAADDTIWLELHGAGRDAEVAGVFVMGVQGDRIRWARIYSALVEPVPAGVVDEPAPGALREVPPYEEAGAPPPAPTPAAATVTAAGTDEVVEESLIAPVLDMDRTSRRRRRSRRGSEEAAGEEPAADDVNAGNADAVAVDVSDAVAVDVSDADAVVDVSDADAVVVVDAGPDVEVAVEASPDTEVVVVTDEPAPAVPEAEVAPPAVEDDGPPTEAVDMVTITEDDDAVPEAPVFTESTDPEPDPDGEPPRRLFGRKRS
jgi:ketosteroid isomerase-like protein